MAILDKIKTGVDIARWQQTSPALNIHAAGVCWASDKRNDIYSFDVAFQLVSTSVLNAMFGTTEASSYVINPGLSAFGAGSEIRCAYTRTYSGTLAAGCTTTKLIVGSTIASQSTDGMVFGETSRGILGYKVRVMYNTAAGTGKTEERIIISNTSGTTPTLFLNYALSSAPADGAAFEIIGIRVYCLGNGATAATQFRYYDVATAAMTSCAGTGLTIATDSAMTTLDEQLVPYDRKPGEGFMVGTGTYDDYYATLYALYPTVSAYLTLSNIFTKNCLTATASAAGTITGQILGGDIGVLQNEYRNFQIRIVEDTGTPTAVGQRRIIASHTAGVLGTSTAPVYTLGSNWSVTPSATAKFVIEYPNQIILRTVAAGNAIYTYNYTNYTQNNGTNSILTNAWSSTYYTASTTCAVGCLNMPSYGHEPTTQVDGSRNSRHSYIYMFRGGSTTLDLFDIAGGTTGSFTAAIAYNAQQTSLSTGTSGDYSPTDQQGRWGYVALNTTGIMVRFDVKYRGFFPWPNSPLQAGTAAVGNRVFVKNYVNSNDITEKLSKIHCQAHVSTIMYRCEALM
jgi:hypothetical protein